MMRAVRQRDTEPELQLRSILRELGVGFLPANVLIYSSSLTAWWEPAQARSMFFAPACDGKTLDGKLFPHPALVFAVRNGRLMVWAIAEDRRPEPDTWLYMAPYWDHNVAALATLCFHFLAATIWFQLASGNRNGISDEKPPLRAVR